MSTRSDIIIHRADGKWHRIYCHWDGYLEHNGRILLDHYTGQKKIEKLVALGDLSILAARCNKPDGHTFDKKVNGYCVAYGRDRGERNVAGTIADKLFDVLPEEDSWTEFTYIWCANPTVADEQPLDQHKWRVGVPGESTQTFVDLGEALRGKVTVTAPVKVFGAVIGQHAPTKPAKNHSWSGGKRKAAP